MDPQNEDRLLSPKAAARVAGTHVATLYRWVLTGRLRATRRAHSRYLIREGDLLAFLRLPTALRRTVAVVRAAGGHDA